MKTHREEKIATQYETVFCIFMAALAFLWRDNPAIVFPQILTFFLMLFALNLGAGLSLRRWPQRHWIPALFIMANCAVITAILPYSGGAQSNLWVLYLLPISTACLLLDFRETLWITLGAIGFNAGFILLEGDRGADAGFELLLKSGIFLFTAAVTWRLAEKDRRNRRQLQERKAELERLEGLTRSQQTRLEQSGRLAQVGMLTSGVAHDLNNAFMAVLGYADLLLDNEDVTAEQRELLVHIKRSILLTQGVSAHLISMAKDKTLETVPRRVSEIVESVLDMFQVSLKKFGIETKLAYDDEDALVLASSSHLERLFLNLFSNSIRAMPEGGILTVQTFSIMHPATRQAEMHVTVEDTGAGIPQEILDSHFAAFSTASRGGTGLGLYICSEIARQHHGSLRAENKPEGGARFILTLPLASPADVPAV